MPAPVASTRLGSLGSTASPISCTRSLCFQLAPPSRLSSSPFCMSPARIRLSGSTASAITFPPTCAETSENDWPPSRER